MTGGYDSRPGCLFLNNRYHDPTLGVFISVDPLVAATGEAYIYASGNPTTLSDPTGLCPYCVAPIEVGIGVYVVVAIVGATVVWGVACTVADCPYDLTDAMSSIASGGWEASKWVVGASVDAGKAIGGAAADAGSTVGDAAGNLWDGAAGLFQDDGDANPDPHGLEDLTGFDSDELGELIAGHAEDGRFTSDELEAITEALRNPDVEIGDTHNGVVSASLARTSR
jgi:RHS repeat-associated protein